VRLSYEKKKKKKGDFGKKRARRAVPEKGRREREGKGLLLRRRKFKKEKREAAELQPKRQSCARGEGWGGRKRGENARCTPRRRGERRLI